MRAGRKALSASAETATPGPARAGACPGPRISRPPPRTSTARVPPAPVLPGAAEKRATPPNDRAGVPSRPAPGVSFRRSMPASASCIGNGVPVRAALATRKALYEVSLYCAWRRTTSPGVTSS